MRLGALSILTQLLSFFLEPKNTKPCVLRVYFPFVLAFAATQTATTKELFASALFIVDAFDTLGLRSSCFPFFSAS
jgi:hypothetical protein